MFSHGNAVDLGQMTSFFIGLGQRINCNIFSYDYSGYGMSTGKPSEKNLYADIDAAWHALRTQYGMLSVRWRSSNFRNRTILGNFWSWKQKKPQKNLRVIFF